MVTFALLQRRARMLVACTLALVFPAAAGASVQACYDLATGFKPHDVTLGYEFMKHHGECVAHFGDPAFQAVAGSLTAIRLSGVLAPGQCGTILSDVNSPAAQQLLSVADAGAISKYLDCGCAVADSGISERVQEVLDDIVSCAKTFDPTGAVASGLEKAGETLGMSDLWGTASNAHNPNAGVGNGGAPTTAYQLQTCALGQAHVGFSHAWDGTPLPWGTHVQSCECPPPTKVYVDGKFHDYGSTFGGAIFLCLACPPGTAMKTSGSCSACENKLGLTGYEIWEPNDAGTSCRLAKVEPTCKLGEEWNGYAGNQSVCCPAWQKLAAGGMSCESRCPPGESFAGGTCSACPPDTQLAGNICKACPSGAHSLGGDGICSIPFPDSSPCPDGAGIVPGTNQCGSCPVDTEIKNGYCMNCPQGTHSNGGGDICSVAFSGTSPCPDGQGILPGTNACGTCPPDTEARNGYCMNCPDGQHAFAGGRCRGAAPGLACTPGVDADGIPTHCDNTCTGNTFRNRRGKCIACAPGFLPNSDHTACRPQIQLVPEGPGIR